ncbi:Nad-dependent epimerase dehydratase [Fragilaria crotonensis]|nr:Nad-dependent epimerase dehydratase [Fragilaria crotonensis]
MTTYKTISCRGTSTSGIAGCYRRQTWILLFLFLYLAIIAKRSVPFDVIHDDNKASLLSNPRRDFLHEKVEPHVGYKKVLVTGGAGFIGSHVAEFLLARGDDVVIVDELNDYYDVGIKQQNLKLLRSKYPSRERLSIHIGDVCDSSFMLRIFEKLRPQWICHMAARAGVRPSIEDPYIYIHSNIQATTRLMDLSHNFGIQNFVFASSSSVYGGSKSEVFSEDEPVDHPISPYAATKKACELLAYTYHHLYHLNVTALRFFTVYGPRGRPDMAPFKFIDRISRGVEIQKFGDGSSSRDYTYIDDIVNGVVRALDRRHKYEIFNLGKGSGTSLKEFIELIEKHVGRTANVRVMPDQPGDVPYTCANVTKAEIMLGYRPMVQFEEGIMRTVKWHMEVYADRIQNITTRSTV